MTGNTLLVPPRSAFRSREELCAFVSYKMRRATELFTFKCSLYQRELKLYLPEPVPKHRRWIDTFDSESIVTIPISKIEKEEIELFRKHYPEDMDLDAIFPGDLLQRSFKKRISILLTSLVNKIVFLLVLRHDTWYVHQEARDGLREYLLNKIWPKQPKMRLLYRDHVTTFVDTRIRHFRDSVGRYFRDLQANSKNSEFISNMIVTCDYKQSDLDDMITKALNEQKLLLEKEKNSEYIDSPKNKNISIPSKEFESYEKFQDPNKNDENDRDHIDKERVEEFKISTDEDEDEDEDEIELQESNCNQDIQRYEILPDSEVKDECIKYSINEPPQKKKNLESNLLDLSTSSISSNITTSTINNPTNSSKDEFNNSPTNKSVYSSSLFTPLPNSIFSLNENKNGINTNSNLNPNLNNISNIVYRSVNNTTSSPNVSSEISSSNINQNNFSVPIINSIPLSFTTYPNLMFNHPNYFNKENQSFFNTLLFNHINPNFQPSPYYVIPNYAYMIQSINNYNHINSLPPCWFSPNIDLTNFHNPFINNKMCDQIENPEDHFNKKNKFENYKEKQ